ncbi:MAG: ATP-binding cassette domain-containing protein [Novosphingobium sp.]|nr:ATP-binding cassette domain-containing protein [Novosphingobium sp.]
MSDLLTITGLTRGFYGVSVLNGVDIAIPEGSFTGLIGPNGAGKSTLFNVVSGLYRPDGGAVTFAGEAVTALPPEALVRRRLVRTFQLARGFPKLSVSQHLIL